MNTSSALNGTSGDILTLEEAAAYLRVTAEAVRAEAEVGRLPGRRIGTEWRFDRDAIRNWLHTPTTPARRLTDLPTTDETPEEQEAVLRRLRELRKSSGPARRPQAKAGR